MGGRRRMPHEADDDVLPAGTSVRVKGLRNDRQLNDAQVRLRVTGSFQRVDNCVYTHSVAPCSCLVPGSDPGV